MQNEIFYIKVTSEIFFCNMSKYSQQNNKI